MLKRFMGAMVMLTTSGGAPSAGALTCDAAVVYRAGSDAYQEALEGIREAFAGASSQVQYIEIGTGASGELAQRLRADCGSPKLVTFIGMSAWTSVAEAAGVPNVLPAVILREDLRSDSTRSAGAVYADVPLTAIAEQLHRVFPGKSRLALIRRTSRSAPDAAALNRVRAIGFEIRIVDCAGPEKLLAAFSALKGKVDFVITEPDSELYNRATLTPLVMASLDQRLPIVGFSAAFVRAGALTGVYPDFRALGRRTGEKMRRILSGKGPAATEDPIEVVIAVNDRIARLMGIEPGDRKGVAILR